MSGPTVSRSQVVEVCAQPYAHQAAARQQAAHLDAAGWRVHHHFPAQATDDPQVLLVATVDDPDSGEQVGRITSGPAEGSAGIVVYR